jgi:hypothetical protein
MDVETKHSSEAEPGEIQIPQAAPAADQPVQRVPLLRLQWPVSRILATALALSIFVLTIWFGGKTLLLTLDRQPDARAQAALEETPTPFPIWADDLPDFDLSLAAWTGISRRAQLHTTLPSRPRYEVVTYTVEKGDTVFGIAEKYRLKADTILWGNYYTLGGNIDVISPGMELNILPVDGLYHKWSEGEGLNGVASFYHVTPEDIVNWPGNNLSLETVGDFSNPNIEPGKMLVIPGGWRPLDSVGVATVSRSNPSAAKYLGSGYCANATSGISGTGSFVWPSSVHDISGYTFSSVHPGIDIAGSIGNPVYAADSGVVVYSGWTDLGYGYIIVLDHGNGWSTYYAHLSAIFVSCGQGVVQGATIGSVGSTGNSTGAHLHFEMHSTAYGKVNPSNIVQ